MAINATTNATQRELIPAGNYIARCYKMVEIGTVKTEWQGQEKELKKARFYWELPNEMRVFNPEKGEQPLSIDKEYTMSMGDKATLRKDLESWRGKAFTDAEATSFDVTKLLGVPCMLNIIHKTSEKSGKQYEQIASITPLPKGIDCPKQINPTFVLSYDNFDQSAFLALPEFIRKTMEESKEYKHLFSGMSAGASPAVIDLNAEGSSLPF